MSENFNSFDIGCVDGPRNTPWNTADLQIATPENTCVIFTAGRALDPFGGQADALRSMGIDVPT
ncbi:hypothetical protein AAE021_13880 [Arthrobacter citreus]|uniref:MBL fold metallo-hydrolase n=1 Tax=Arthrobacter citreus TaxID=1670 RepID=A0ABZ2ZSV1_9MICC